MLSCRQSDTAPFVVSDSLLTQCRTAYILHHFRANVCDGRVGLSLSEVKQWKHPERIDGFVVERGQLRVDMEAFDRAYAIRPEKRAIQGSRSLDARAPNC